MGLRTYFIGTDLKNVDFSFILKILWNDAQLLDRRRGVVHRRNRNQCKRIWRCTWWSFMAARCVRLPCRRTTSNRITWCSSFYRAASMIWWWNLFVFSERVVGDDDVGQKSGEIERSRELPAVWRTRTTTRRATLFDNEVNGWINDWGSISSFFR